MVITQKNWGPYGWKFMHMVALGYPINPTEEEKQNYKTFFTVLGDVLPCQMCADHYKENLIKFPLTDYILSSTDSLLKWTIDLHNHVNISIGKKIINYDDAIKLIKNNYVDGTKIDISVQTDNQVTPINITREKKNITHENKNNTFLYLLFFLFISLVLIAVMYKKN